MARAARDLIHGHVIPAFAGCDRFGGIENLCAPTLFFFVAAVGKVIHGRTTLRYSLTLCQ